MANKIPNSYKADASNAIKNEIGRFEGVHPNIYAIYELLEQLDVNENIKDSIRQYVVAIEDSFVNSQEWTLPRFVNVLKLAVVGTVNSGKSALVHRYLTDNYLHEESPEGGRFKKEIIVDNQSCLLLIRDEGGCPDRQMTQWADGLILVFSLENEESLNIVTGEYYRQMKSHRDLSNVPILLVGSQDMISDSSPRMVDDARGRHIASQLCRNSNYYFETCATYGLNVDTVFVDICYRMLAMSVRSQPNGTSANNSHHHHLRSRPTTPQVINSHNNNAGMMSPHSFSALTQPKQRSINSSTNNTSNNHFDPNFSRTGSYVSTHKNSVASEEPPPLPARPENMAPIRPLDPRIRLPLNCPTKTPEQHEFDAANYQKSLPIRSGNNQLQQPTPHTPQLHHSSQQYNTKQQPQPQQYYHRHQLSNLSNEYPLDQSQIVSNNSNNGAAQQHVYAEYNMLRSTTTMNRQTPCNMTPFVSNVVGAGNGGVGAQSLKTNSDRDLPPSTNEKSNKQLNSQSNSTGNVIGSGRSIPVKQGYLYKKSSNQLNKDRKNRKYVTLTDDGKLTYYSSMNDYMNQARGKEINLQLTSIKLPGVPYRNSCLPSSATPSSTNSGPPNFNTPNTPTQRSSDSNPPIVSDSMTTAYLADMGVSTETANNRNNTSKDATKTKRHRRMKSNIKGGSGSGGGTGAINDGENDGDNVYEFILVDNDNHQWSFESGSMEDRDDWVIQIECVLLQMLTNDGSSNIIGGSTGSSSQTGASQSQDGVNNVQNNPGHGINSVSGNDWCADCAAPDPQWASLNLGVCICIECCGVHRQLGSHISRVRSLTLDEWPEENIGVMKAIGNTMANSVWEAARHSPNIINNISNGTPNTSCGNSTIPSNGSINSNSNSTNNNSPLTKPAHNSSRALKEAWIRAKYERKLYLPPLPHPDAPLQQQLVDAISRQDTRQLLLCLAVIGNTNILDTAYSEHDSRTPLHIAATLGNIVYLQLLLWAGASSNVVDQEGRTPFFYAYYSNQLKAANFLLRACPQSNMMLPAAANNNNGTGRPSAGVALTTDTSGDLFVPTSNTQYIYQTPPPTTQTPQSCNTSTAAAVSTTLPRQHFHPPPNNRTSTTINNNNHMIRSNNIHHTPQQYMSMYSHTNNNNNNNMVMMLNNSAQQSSIDNNNYIDFTTQSSTPIPQQQQLTTQSISQQNNNINNNNQTLIQ